MVFADGVFAFLDEPTVAAVFRRIPDHFRGGVVTFYDYGRVSQASRRVGSKVHRAGRMSALLSAA